MAGTVCRAATLGTCDVNDVCTGGTSCPVRAAAAGTPCRNAVNSCDVTESCDGVNETCPSNGFASSTTLCGADVTYTGPAHNAANCGGVNACGPGLLLNCIDSDMCSGTAATCTRCTCFCE
jgi:hypothetical protein